MGATNRLSNDWPLFRYADVLIMKAECLLRTGDAPGAATLVTQVCQRNFKSNPANAIVTGADIQYGRFLDELGLEFNQGSPS
jgi:starch-binding outer membrane protein, SusD/RagB family